MPASACSTCSTALLRAVRDRRRARAPRTSTRPAPPSPSSPTRWCAARACPSARRTRSRPTVARGRRRDRRRPRRSDGYAPFADGLRAASPAARPRSTRAEFARMSSRPSISSPCATASAARRPRRWPRRSARYRAALARLRGAAARIAAREAAAARELDARIRQAAGWKAALMASARTRQAWSSATARSRSSTASTSTIADGEFVVLVGPSGCGKSTTLRMIAGLEDITGGTICDRRRAWSTSVEPKDRNIAMVFQNYAIYPHMTVAQNIGFGLHTAEAPARPRSDKRIARRRAMLGPRAAARAPARRALRRPAPARRHRPRHGARSRRLPVRRAALQPRRAAARADAHRDQAAAPAARHAPSSSSPTTRSRR